MKIRILHPAPVRLDLQPGDELIVQRSSPAIEQLLTAARLDGARFAIVVDADEDAEYATLATGGETATLTKGRTARGARS